MRGHVSSGELYLAADHVEIAQHKCEGAVSAHVMLHLLTLEHKLAVVGAGEGEERAHWPVVLRNLLICSLKGGRILATLLACIGSLGAVI